MWFCRGWFLSASSLLTVNEDCDSFVDYFAKVASYLCVAEIPNYTVTLFDWRPGVFPLKTSEGGLTLVQLAMASCSVDDVPILKRSYSIPS